MKSPIFYIDRLTGKQEIEQIYGEGILAFLYGNGFLSKIFSKALLVLFAKTPFASRLFGWWQKRKWTARKIAPFIKKYKIDESEFLEKTSDFSSFNDFFIRKLKPAARPIAQGNSIAIIPADGRYLFHQRIDKSEGFVVKGQKFDLKTLLNDASLASEYSQGAMVLARLCPTDYHRFHFPCDGIPSKEHLINGWLYSVNPIAIKKNINIFTQNKRTITFLETDQFGKIIYIEVGATNVGSIIQTYQPNVLSLKGGEKGYFSFGASSLILLFPPNKIRLDPQLLAATAQGIEIKCLLGQTMGQAI